MAEDDADREQLAPSLLPPFDADRFRDERSSRPDAGEARTVPMWVLLVAIVVSVAIGVVLGAVR